MCWLNSDQLILFFPIYLKCLLPKISGWHPDHKILNKINKYITCRQYTRAAWKRCNLKAIYILNRYSKYLRWYWTTKKHFFVLAYFGHSYHTKPLILSENNWISSSFSENSSEVCRLAEKGFCCMGEQLFDKPWKIFWSGYPSTTWMTWS